MRTLLAKALDALRKNNLELAEEYASTAISYLNQAYYPLNQIEDKAKGGNYDRRTKDTDELQLITFEINDKIFTVDVKNVREIINVKDIVKVPKALHHVKGVMNFRGKIITLVNLACTLSFGSIINNKNKVLIYAIVNDKDTGLAVDHVLGILRINSKSIEKPTIGINSYVRGFIKSGDIIMILLDMDKTIKELKSILRELGA